MHKSPFGCRLVYDRIHWFLGFFSNVCYHTYNGRFGWAARFFFGRIDGGESMLTQR